MIKHMNYRASGLVPCRGLYITFLKNRCMWSGNPNASHSPSGRIYPPPKLFDKKARVAPSRGRVLPSLSLGAPYVKKYTK